MRGGENEMEDVECGRRGRVVADYTCGGSNNTRSRAAHAKSERAARHADCLWDSSHD